MTSRPFAPPLLFRPFRKLGKTPFAMLLALFLFGFTNQAFAQLKVALLDAQRAVLSTDEAQKLQADLEEEFKSELESITRLNDEITELENRLSRENDILSEEARRKLLAEARIKRLRRDGQTQILQELQNQRLTELAQEIQPKLRAVLQDLVEVERYDLVLAYTPQNVLYVNSKHDITRIVTEKLNERKAEPQ